MQTARLAVVRMFPSKPARLRRLPAEDYEGAWIINKSRAIR